MVGDWKDKAVIPLESQNPSSKPLIEKLPESMEDNQVGIATHALVLAKDTS